MRFRAVRCALAETRGEDVDRDRVENRADDRVAGWCVFEAEALLCDFAAEAGAACAEATTKETSATRRVTVLHMGKGADNPEPL